MSQRIKRLNKLINNKEMSIFKKITAISTGLIMVLSSLGLPGKVLAETGSISITVAGANSPTMADELSAISVLAYNGTTPLNGSGEYIPKASFTGSQSYGFTIGNVNLNTSNTYKIGVAFFGADGQIVNYNNYTLQANGTSLSKIDTNIFASDVVGTVSGSAVQYSININRAATDSIAVTVPAMSDSAALSELSAMSVLVYNGSSPLNGSGEYIPANNFTNSGSYGFTIGNLNLNSSKSYTIGVALHTNASSVALGNYEVKANGVSLVRDSGNPGVFSNTVTGSLSGNSLSYSLTVKRNVTPPTPTSPPTSGSSNTGSGAGGGDYTPQGTKVTINNGALTATNSNVTLSLSVFGEESRIQIQVSNNEDFSGAADWEAFTKTKNWTLSSGSGEKKVYVRFRDIGFGPATLAVGSISLSEVSASNTTSTATSTATSTGGTVLGVSAFRFTEDIEFGMKSESVKNLQTRLTDEGYFNYQISDYYGPVTLKAVKAYQRAKGITPTGIVGPLTRAELNKSTGIAKTISTPVVSVTVIEKSAADKVLEQEKIQKELLTRKAELLQVLRLLLTRLQAQSINR